MSALSPTRRVPVSRHDRERFRALDNDGTHPNFSVPYSQEGYVHYVVDAVFTLVIAIQKLVDEKCPKSPSSNAKPVCPEFFPFDGTKLLSILRNVSFRNGKPCTRADRPVLHSSVDSFRSVAAEY